MLLAMGIETMRQQGILETYYVPQWAKFGLIAVILAGFVVAWCGSRAAARRGILVVTGLIIVIALSGCADDPWRNALAKGQSTLAENSLADRAESRSVNANIQTLQERNAIVAGQAAVASSNAISSIVASNNQTMLVLADKLIEARRPDHTVLYVVLAVLAVVVVLVVVIVARMNVAMAQASAQPQWRALPNRSPARVLPPPRVQAEADRRGAMAIWDPDGAYWTLVNEETGQTWTQRKQIVAK